MTTTTPRDPAGAGPVCSLARDLAAGGGSRNRPGKPVGAAPAGPAAHLCRVHPPHAVARRTRRGLGQGRRARRTRGRHPGRPGGSHPVRAPPVRIVRGTSGADALAERAGTDGLAQAQGRRRQHDALRPGAARGAGDHAGARRRRRARRREDVDAARLQGPGVSARVSGRRGRGAAASPGQRR
ncbi:hypothetical protein G6F65_019719 [Rhizopus arrhizus]|nr:hypothetical protein G6F65_019719 [Rhizopus arrhizus]